jgi:hypothetical protein
MSAGSGSYATVKTPKEGIIIKETKKRRPDGWRLFFHCAKVSKTATALKIIDSVLSAHAFHNNSVLKEILQLVPLLSQQN